MLTTFWDLCSDVILEICGYFSIDELFFSFYPDVLPDLFELLIGSHTNLHLCLTNDDLPINKLLSLINTKQIISLHISANNIPFNEFGAVKTLTLDNARAMIHAISLPLVLPSLQRLILIYSGHLSYEAEHALKLVFSRSSLKYLKLHLSDDYSLIPRNPLGRSSSIEQFVINASCSPLTLKLLLDSLPCLRVFRIKTLMDIKSTMVRNQLPSNNTVASAFPMINHSSLQIIDIDWYLPIMANIIILLKGLPNLKHCRISGVINSKELNGKFWYNLITRICSKLLKMNVNMLIWTSIKAEEIKINFDQDMFFKRIGFKLKPSDKEAELLMLTGDFRRTL